VSTNRTINSVSNFELGKAQIRRIFTSDFRAKCPNELNSSPVVSASVNGGVAKPGELLFA
jgi:hypothetical protein